jgi:hypothetical protein
LVTDVIAKKLELDDRMVNLLVGMYGKCAEVDTAHRIFLAHLKRGSVGVKVWNSMLVGK